MVGTARTFSFFWCLESVFSFVLCLVALFYFGLVCFVLFCFALFCLFCFILLCFALLCFVLFCFAPFCFAGRLMDRFGSAWLRGGILPLKCSYCKLAWTIVLAVLLLLCLSFLLFSR